MLGTKNRNLTNFCFAFMNIKLKILTTKSGINPNVNVIPALSHDSAGNIASGYGIVVL